MRLSLTVFLVTLALLCYEANAKACPALLSELKSFFVDNINFYNMKLTMLGLPSKPSAAMAEVKKCVDKYPYKERLNMYKVVKKILGLCKN
ncbi:secretoglobin family 1D member 2-like [Pteronotus mesoamericanus]|uniref:secretoglobin family 1D member 2-like n=1 Tax=Pteronotus mesoamericanus TaxID=1884717 RepID=UPI0023EAE005|nr:secretoglobin family 1D member 2-like [Pteronotus parnellii mesoamericanus]